MLLQHDKARPHTSLKTREAITKFGLTLLPHPPYIPDLAPSGFHPFGDLKNAVCGVKFKTDGNVISTVRTWLHEQDKEWYQQGTHTFFSLVQGCRSGQRLGKKTGFGDKPSDLNMSYFHEFE
jgi:histone-lysine N-methyltransferase SETMAR